MDENEEEFTTTLAVKIGLAVAVFLLTTGRVLQAFDLCKECLIMLNNRALIGDSGIDNTVETALNIITAHAYQVQAAKWYEWQVQKIPGESTCNKERNWWQKRRSIRWRKIRFPPPFFRQVSLNWEISPVGICSTHGLWRQKSRIEATFKGNLSSVLQSLG